MMIPECKKRLSAAFADLQALLVSGYSSRSPQDPAATPEFLHDSHPYTAAADLKICCSSICGFRV
jgi:hypothetical protein